MLYRMNNYRRMLNNKPDTEAPILTYASLMQRSASMMLPLSVTPQLLHATSRPCASWPPRQFLVLLSPSGMGLGERDGTTMSSPRSTSVEGRSVDSRNVRIYPLEKG